MQILIHMTYQRLGGDLRAHFNKKHKRKNFKRYAWPFTQAEVDAKLADLAQPHAAERESYRRVAPYGDRIIQMLHNRPPCSSADTSVPGVFGARRSSSAVKTIP